MPSATSEDGGTSTSDSHETVFTCRKPGCENKQFDRSQLDEHKEFHRKQREEKRKRKRPRNATPSISSIGSLFVVRDNSPPPPPSPPKKRQKPMPKSKKQKAAASAAARRKRAEDIYNKDAESVSGSSTTSGG